MHASTPSGDPVHDPRPDTPVAKHGDVDINGDLVDELTWQLGPPAMRAARRQARLAAAITAPSGELEAAQLAAVQRALARIPA